MAVFDGLRALVTGGGSRSSAAAIANTCSVAAQVGLPVRAAYSASKGAVLALTLAVAATT